MSRRKFEAKTERFTNSEVPKLLFGGAILGGVAVSSVASPLVGIPLGLLMAYRGFTADCKLAECEEAVLEKGLVAPFLTSRTDLFDYAAEVGEEQALREIQTACDRNLPISAVAFNFHRVKTNRPHPTDRTSEIATNTDGTHPWDDAEMLAQQLVVFAGGMGSGKSTRLGGYVERRLKQGGMVLLLNPFSSAREWRSLPVAGRTMGLDPFEDVENALLWFSRLIDARAKLLREDATFDPLQHPHVCLACEEMTNWGSRIDAELLRGFWERSLQTLRQLNASVVIATHATTLDGLGGKKAAGGYADAIKRQACIFKLHSRTNPDQSPGQSPKIPAETCEFKPANEEKYRSIPVDMSFAASRGNGDFSHLTGYPPDISWLDAVGIPKQA